MIVSFVYMAKKKKKARNLTYFFFLLEFNT